LVLRASPDKQKGERISPFPFIKNRVNLSSYSDGAIEGFAGLLSPSPPSPETDGRSGITVVVGCAWLELGPQPGKAIIPQNKMSNPKETRI